jgi:hypothetical protein
MGEGGGSSKVSTSQRLGNNAYAKQPNKQKTTTSSEGVSATAMRTGQTTTTTINQSINQKAKHKQK